MKKKVFILGAGASVEFLKDDNGKGLCTKKLTEAIRNKELWVQTFNEMASVLKDKMRPIDIVVDDFFFLIDDLCSDFETFYDNANRGHLSSPETLDFEKIISYLDCVVKYLRDYKGGSGSKYNPYVHLFRHSCGSKLKKLELKNEKRFIPFWAREVLHRYISSFTFEKASSDILRRYFIQEAEKHENISIFSLNYDSFLYESLKDTVFCNGFIGDKFDDKHYRSENHTLSFLHGHQYFYACGGGIGMAKTSDEAFKNRANGLLSNCYLLFTKKGMGFRLLRV